jgi:hypothetical protein
MSLLSAKTYLLMASRLIRIIVATHYEVTTINGMDIDTVVRDTRAVAERKLSRGFIERMNTIRPGCERHDLRLACCRELKHRGCGVASQEGRSIGHPILNLYVVGF